MLWQSGWVLFIQHFRRKVAGIIWLNGTVYWFVNLHLPLQPWEGCSVHGHYHFWEPLSLSQPTIWDLGALFLSWGRWQRWAPPVCGQCLFPKNPTLSQIIDLRWILRWRFEELLSVESCRTFWSLTFVLHCCTGSRFRQRRLKKLLSSWKFKGNLKELQTST